MSRRLARRGVLAGALVRYGAQPGSRWWVRTSRRCWQPARPGPFDLARKAAWRPPCWRRWRWASPLLAGVGQGQEGRQGRTVGPEPRTLRCMRACGGKNSTRATQRNERRALLPTCQGVVAVLERLVELVSPRSVGCARMADWARSAGPASLPAPPICAAPAPRSRRAPARIFSSVIPLNAFAACD